MAIAKIGGRTYDIPDYWITGFCHDGRHTVDEAIRFWHEQTLINETFNCHCIDCSIAEEPTH